MNDLYFGEEEVQVDFGKMAQKIEGDNRIFKIEKCPKCGKVPEMKSHHEIEGKGRYEIKCCGVRILERTQTACIYQWNLNQFNGEVTNG